MIAGVALTMHALVAITGSLLPAMVVHFLYDLLAGLLIRAEADRLGIGAAATPAGE